MAIRKDGLEWWVLGYTKEPVDLPKWEGWKFEARLADGTERIVSGSEVRSSCGDVLTLADGSVATNLRK
jgi:hypothetical protein